MTAFPTSYLGIASRTRLAAMLAPTYGEARNIHPNEAYERLEASLRYLDLIEALQNGIWRALCELRPSSSPEDLVKRAEGRLAKRRLFKPALTKRADVGAWAALTVRIDLGAGVGSGEAYGLLDTPDGARLLSQGIELISTHLAKEILR